MRNIMIERRRVALCACLAVALVAPATAIAQGRPDYCRPGWGRSDSGLSDAQRQVCTRLSPPTTEPPCEGESDACQALRQERQLETTELGAETQIESTASPRLKHYFHETDDITMQLVAAYRANACGLRGDRWYNDLTNGVWLLGIQERRRLGLSAAENQTANRLTDLRFKRLGQPRCSEFTAEGLRQLDAFAAQIEHAYR
jgi:hypothetical protein